MTPRVRGEGKTTEFVGCSFSKPRAVAKYGVTVGQSDMLSTDARHH